MPARHSVLFDFQRAIGTRQPHSGGRRRKLARINSCFPPPSNLSPQMPLALAASERDLIQQSIEGDPNANEQLFKVPASRLYRAAFNVLRNKEDAEDALQDGLFRAYTNLKFFEGRSSFSTWLTRIVINSALMILRKHRSAREVFSDALVETAKFSPIHQIPDDFPNPEHHYVERERRKILHEAVGGLPPRIRAVVEFGQLQGLSLKETARALGISVGAAKGRLFHARATLQRSTALRAIAKVATAPAVRPAQRFALTAPEGKQA